MTAKQVMTELEALGTPAIRKILLQHGAREPLFGVKISDMKPIQKKIKMDYQLAKDLYATGNTDAQYFAGLIADDAKMTKADLQTWVKGALSQNISEYTVPWVAAGSEYGYELALEWIGSPKEYIAAAGWSTLANLVALQPDSKLDLPELTTLLGRAVKEIHSAPNRVRYVMNNFVTCVGGYVPPLSKEAIAAAKKIGVVTVDMGGTACKMPVATEYIQKAIDRGSLTKKKKTVKC
ncbi:MAG TPA: DNA alkylation repair protein [Puia sp.]|jgi:3-methyladenine DNA glycosylase AlkD|nr:DNA alkylation repair protein [Puia sp.]